MSTTKKTLRDTEYYDSIIRARNFMICDIKKSLRLANEVFTNGKSPVGAPNFLLALSTITFSGYENILEEFQKAVDYYIAELNTGKRDLLYKLEASLKARPMLI